MTTVIEEQPRPLVEIAALRDMPAEAVLAMVGRCSPATLYKRFHGATDGIAYTRRRLDPNGSAITAGARAGDQCVGMGELIPAPSGRWELAVLVEDRWQRQGVGRLLVRGLIRKAHSVGINAIRADILGEQSQLAGPLSRIGETRSRIASGTVTVDVELFDNRAVGRTRAA